MGGGGDNQGRKEQCARMERFIMELIAKKTRRAFRKERGMSLIELMIAMVVLLVGIVGSMALIAYAIGGNGRSRQESNATVVAQMLAEKISSQKASLSNNLTVYDCVGTANTVYTAVGGGALTGGGDVDMTQTAVTGYQMYYTDCGTSGRQMIYDVRWTITQPTTYTKLVIVTAMMKGAGTDLKHFSLPVSVRSLIGQGT
jgi:prepilin-type N-terminal cleavage/methylation domain-containing protein